MGVMTDNNIGTVIDRHTAQIFLVVLGDIDYQIDSIPYDYSLRIKPHELNQLAEMFFKKYDHETPFAWLLSVDQPDLAFVVADPWLFAPDYQP